MSKLVYSAIKTPDGTILNSRHGHDFVTHLDKNGEEYMLDGGLDYIRSTINKVPAEDLSLTLEDPHDKIREVVTWGSYGKYGNGPLRNIPVKDMADKHIAAVIILPYIHTNIREVLLNELEYRALNNITITG